MKKGLVVVATMLAVGWVAVVAWFLAKPAGFVNGGVAWAHAAAATVIPETTFLILTVDVGKTEKIIGDVLDEAAWLPDLSQSANAEIEAFFVKRLGWYPREVSTATAALGEYGVLVVVPLRTGFLPPAGMPTRRYGDFTILGMDNGVDACGVSGWLAMGTPGGVEAFIDTFQGRTLPLARASQWQTHKELSSRVGNVDVLLTSNVTVLPDKFFTAFPMPGVQGLVLGMQYDGGLEIQVKATPEARQALLARLSSAKTAVLERVNSVQGETDNMSLVLGVAAIWAHHHLGDVLTRLFPKESGEYVVFSMDESVVAFPALAAVVSFWGVPILIQYLQYLNHDVPKETRRL